MKQNQILLFKILFFFHLLYLIPDFAYSQESMVEDVVIRATFGTPNEYTLIELNFKQGLDESSVKNLEEMARTHRYLWETRPRLGSRIVQFKSEESFKGKGYRIYELLKKNNIHLNRHSVESTFN